MLNSLYKKNMLPCVPKYSTTKNLKDIYKKSRKEGNKENKRILQKKWNTSVLLETFYNTITGDFNPDLSIFQPPIQH